MTAATADVRDERVARVGWLRALLAKPEFGALAGVIVIFLFFAVQSDVFRSANGAANWLFAGTVYYQGDAGVQVGPSGLATGIMTTWWGLNIYASLVVSLLLMLAIGFVNGFLVTRTGLPSFIITLGMFLGLQGVNLGVTKKVTNPSR